MITGHSHGWKSPCFSSMLDVGEISLRCRSGRWHHGFGFLHPIHGCRCREFRLTGESSMYVQLGERTSLQPVGWVKGSCFFQGQCDIC